MPTPWPPSTRTRQAASLTIDILHRTVYYIYALTYFAHPRPKTSTRRSRLASRGLSVSPAGSGPTGSSKWGTLETGCPRSEILALLDGHQPCMLFEQLFLNRMPDNIRLQLTDTDFTDPRKVAEHADELWQAMSLNSCPTIHKVTMPGRQTRAKSTGPAKETCDNSADWCYYHNKFGDKARKCVQPCTFSGNARAGRQ